MSKVQRSTWNIAGRGARSRSQPSCCADTRSSRRDWRTARALRSPGFGVHRPQTRLTYDKCGRKNSLRLSYDGCYASGTKREGEERTRHGHGGLRRQAGCDVRCQGTRRGTRNEHGEVGRGWPAIRSNDDYCTVGWILVGAQQNIGGYFAARTDALIPQADKPTVIAHDPKAHVRFERGKLAGEVLTVRRMPRDFVAIVLVRWRRRPRHCPHGSSTSHRELCDVGFAGASAGRVNANAVQRQTCTSRAPGSRCSKTGGLLLNTTQIHNDITRCRSPRAASGGDYAGDPNCGVCGHGAPITLNHDGAPVGCLADCARGLATKSLCRTPQRFGARDTGGTTENTSGIRRAGTAATANASGCGQTRENDVRHNVAVPNCSGFHRRIKCSPADFRSLLKSGIQHRTARTPVSIELSPPRHISLQPGRRPIINRAYVLRDGDFFINWCPGGNSPGKATADHERAHILLNHRPSEASFVCWSGVATADFAHRGARSKSFDARHLRSPLG